MGKIGVAVSPANPDRVFAIVEAEKGGLYRSDDAGKTWRLLSEDRADPDALVVLHEGHRRSEERGRRVGDERADAASRSTAAARSRRVPATHGDNHALWINPKDRAT